MTDERAESTGYGQKLLVNERIDVDRIMLVATIVTTSPKPSMGVLLSMAIQALATLDTSVGKSARDASLEARTNCRRVTATFRSILYLLY